MLGPIYYMVKQITGDYAMLERTDKPEEELNQVARALLPEDIDEGSRLVWQNLQYTLLEA